MRRLSLLFAALMLLFVSCTEIISEPTNIGGITGFVVDKTTGDPVQTVNVKLKETGASTVTGSDGSFTFNDLENGEYTVLLSKEGYNDNSNTIQVTNGKTIESHFTIERIPAVLTIDREVLDFGDNYSNTTLSFSMVNKNYVDLDWEIVYSCRWIQEVDPMKSVVKLGFGKTQTVVVIIDRDALLAGDNETVLVVRTSDGSSELKIIAVGQEREKAKLNMTGVTDITSSTAIFTGKIESPGIPAYTERGFVCGMSPNPVLGGESILEKSVEVTEESEFSAYITGLIYGNKYYVRAYAKNSEGVAYSTNQIDFTMVATLPVVSMYGVNNLSATNKSAMLHGSVDNPGDPEFTERGFVYSNERNTPTIKDQYIKVDGNELGTFEAVISNLVVNREYYVRAYAKNEGGIAYSEHAEPFTVKITMPEVELTSISNINPTTKSATFRGQINNSGDPAYTERGFVYSSANDMPTISDILVKVDDGHGDSFSADVSELSYEAEYYVRAYAINDGGIVYSNVEHFNLPTEMPSVITRESNNINRGNGSVTLNAEITSVGVPEYIERGFVYSTTNSNPTTTDNKLIVEGHGKGQYSLSTTLQRTGTTYVRAYVTSELGTAYGDAVRALGPEYVYISASRLYVQIVDQGSYVFSSASSACSSSKVEGMTGWHLPSLDELKIVYANRGIIGGLSGTYWSSTYTYESLWNGSRAIAYYIMNFGSGTTSTVQVEYSPYNTMAYRVRCVR